MFADLVINMKKKNVVGLFFFFLFLSVNLQAKDSKVTDGDIYDPDGSGVCRIVIETTEWCCADGTNCSHTLANTPPIPDQWIIEGVKWFEVKYFRTLPDGRHQWGKRTITYGEIRNCFDFEKQFGGPPNQCEG